jgi:type I restriction enzyme S subunit
MKLPSYPKTKPSGVEWLGDVPVHWEVDRLKRSSSRVTDGAHISPDLSSSDFPFVSTIDLKGGKIDFDGCLRTSDECFRYLVRTGCRPLQGDLLFSKDGTVGRTAVVDVDREFVVASSLVIVSPKPNRLDPKFLDYWLNNSILQQDILLQISGAALRRISIEKVSRLPVWLPPPAEQTAIAAFLDRETGRVDRLVAKKRELIERLKEKRTALISACVTGKAEVRMQKDEKGNPSYFCIHPSSVPKKPSGIEWLGDVPEHWEVVPLFRIADAIQTGPFGSQLHAADYAEGGIPLINPAHIVANRIVPDELSAVDKATARRLSRHRLGEGDIIMARRGEIGRCAVAGQNEVGWLCGTGSLVIRLGESKSSYFAAIFSGAGFSGLLELNAVGTTMLNINPTIIGRMIVPIPPLAEQTAIAAYLDAETAKLDGLVAKVEIAIERLQEYRTALITAAVTGKIDVRKEVAL